jgi:MYXO-CTERM domain-containing protein
MKKTLPSLAALACAALALCSPAAQAVSLTSVVDNGNVVDTSFSTDSQISLDLSYFNSDPVTLTYTVSADDILAGSVSFDAIVRQVAAGQSFNQITLGLTGGALFSLVGSVSSLNNATPVSAGTQGIFENLALVSVAGTTTEAYLGDPLLEGATEWRIGFGTLQANQTFTLIVAAPAATPAVPEPATWALALGGLGLLAGVARRRA